MDISATNVFDSAHYGYIYCMTILPERDGVIQLATGSGDETVKVFWMILLPALSILMMWSVVELQLKSSYFDP